MPGSEQIPVSDFFRPPIFSAPQLNPAGTHFAALVSTQEDRTDLVSFDLAAKKFERLTGGKNYDIYSFDWMNDRRIVFSLSEAKLYSSGMFAAEVGHFDRSYVLQSYNVIVPVGFPTTQSSEMLIWIKNSAKGKGADGGLMRIDTRRSFDSKDSSLNMEGVGGLRADVITSYPAPNKGIPVRYLSDKEGELAYAITVMDGVYGLYRYENNRWLPSAFDFENGEIASVGDTPDELIVSSQTEKGKPQGLYRWNAKTARLGEHISQSENFDADVVNVIRDPRDRHIIGIECAEDAIVSTWLDQAYFLLQQKLNSFFPKSVVTILGSDRAKQQFLFSVSSDIRPTVYYQMRVVDRKAQVTSLVSLMPWIDPERMRPMQTLSYRSRDGFKIKGFLTLPAGASKQKQAPLVVLPHGGPWTRDVWGWDREVQFFANRGYAVFQPNYRGSTGVSWEFPSDDMWAFRKMHDDVTDGVRELIKSGLIDRDRIAIMGSSFGGYLAICGAAYEPDLYRCAITVSGVFDWEQVIKQSRRNEYVRGRYGVLRRNLGDPAQNAAKFEEISPLHSISSVKIPIYVAHGVDDENASVEQSKKLISELKKYHVSFEKQVEPGEGHGFRKLETEVRLYSAVESFLAKNMVPRVGTGQQP